MLIQVQGGTGAGRKRPLAPAPRPWTCPAGHLNAAHRNACLHPGCRERRP